MEKLPVGLTWTNAYSLIGKSFLLLVLAVAACTSERIQTVPNRLISFTTLEEHKIAGTVAEHGDTSDGDFFVVKSVRHGEVTLDSNTGNFVFEPNTDFYGEAGFDFVHSKLGMYPALSTVLIVVQNVNDSPQIAFIPDSKNTVNAESTILKINVVDPDPEPPTLDVLVADPTIVAAIIDSDSGELTLRAMMRGSTDIEITATDLESSDSATFHFTVDEYAESTRLAFSNSETGAVDIYNDSDLTIDFLLEHNGFPVFENVNHIVEYIRSSPSMFAGEPFERKLWRFVRDNVYHDVPLAEKRWLYDPWVTINSLGWGFCGNVAGAFVEIARAAGYEARVWGLNGHVVPEILVNGSYRMYDPDLAVYYKTHDGSVADVESLTTDATLITIPYDPIFSGTDYHFPYSDHLAEIFTTDNDNFIGDEIFLASNESPSGRIELPPHARLTYPGRWTETVTGFDGSVPFDVRHFHQAMLSLDQGYTGAISLPWVVWEVWGDGQIGIDKDVFDIGSQELADRIQNTDAPVTSITVYSGSSIRIIFLINAVRFNVRDEVEVKLTSFGNWALNVAEHILGPEYAAGSPIDSSLRKPLPTVIP